MVKVVNESANKDFQWNGYSYFYKNNKPYKCKFGTRTKDAEEISSDEWDKAAKKYKDVFESQNTNEAIEDSDNSQKKEIKRLNDIINSDKIYIRQLEKLLDNNSIDYADYRDDNYRDLYKISNRDSWRGQYFDN
jgi:hypothetical protein